MKKLFIYALLLMTGFAFYSCDDRFDNPVAEQQDPTNPNATWSYEVSVKFANYSNDGYKDVDGKKYTYTAPSTIYVYNKSFEKLGELTVTEPEEFPDSFTVADFDKSYKFAGKLQGAVGEELIIATLDNLDYISKQDGTQKSIMKYLSYYASADAQKRICPKIMFRYPSKMLKYHSVQKPQQSGTYNTTDTAFHRFLGT